MAVERDRLGSYVPECIRVKEQKVHIIFLFKNIRYSTRQCLFQGLVMPLGDEGIMLIDGLYEYRVLSPDSTRVTEKQAGRDVFEKHDPPLCMPGRSALAGLAKGGAIGDDTTDVQAAASIVLNGFLGVWTRSVS